MISKILAAKSYGNAEVLEIIQQELPPLKNGFARIKVKYAGINPIDARRMTGEFKHGGLPQTFGSEFTGSIVEIATNSNGWNIGDDVLGSGGAFTHASVIDVPVENLVLKPENVSSEIAGTIAGVAQTAVTIIQELGEIKSLLIHGGSGGVGSITIQLAVEKGIDVVATASEKNQEYIKSLGATPVVYGPGLIDRIKELHPETFDASIDMVGSEEATQTSLAVVKPNGKIGSIAGKPLSSNRVQAMWTKRDPRKIQYVVDGISKGKFQWQIDRVFSFEQVHEAYSYLLKGHSKGKNALKF